MVFARVDLLAAKFVLANAAIVQVDAVTDTVAHLGGLDAAAVGALKLAGLVARLACEIDGERWLVR